ncbi:MAG: BTAD domain-containing putative transcriptional regulator [Thermodesulfobacteriota bacterium]
MKSAPPPIAKITPPRVSGAVPRPRLFVLLDKGAAKPLLWVTAPAGAGKSTLVSGWLEERGLSCIWYQADEADADPATFIYYLGLAAQQANPRKKRRLPLLTPEYAAGIPAFARRFFEELFSRLPSPYVLVFDNYQEIPSTSLIHDLLLKGMEVIPAGITMIMISRGEPPPQFLRLKANNLLAVLGWNEIRFTLEEVREAVKTVRRGRCLEVECPGPEILFEKTDGWAAGLRLIIEATQPQRRIVANSSPGSPICHCVESVAWKDDVFSYFACEVMHRAGKSVSDLLFATSFLPFVTTAMAVKLTGLRDAAAILTDLSRSNFFTEWLPGPVPVYRYHFLFREYLQDQARELYGTERCAEIMREGAALLEEAGFPEEATELFCTVGEFDRAALLISRIAWPLLAQGRSKAVEGLLAPLPETIIAADAGLLHIAGLCCLAVNPGKALTYLEASFRLLRERMHNAAAVAVCGSVIEAILYQADAFTAIDPYVDWLDGIAEGADAPVRDALKKVSGTVLFVLANRDPSHPALPFWLERAEEALTEATEAMGTLKLCNHLMAYHLFRGEFGSITRLMQTAMPWKKGAGTVPLLELLCILLESYHAVFVQGEAADGMALAREGLARARETGVLVYDFWLSYLLVSASLATGDLPAGEALLQRMFVEGERLPRKRAADLQSLAGKVAFAKGDWNLAAEHFRAALDLGYRLGDRFSFVWTRICLAQAWLCRGEIQAAREILAEAAGQDWAHSLWCRYQGLLTSALIDLREGAEERGLVTLREALALGRKDMILQPPFWNREMTASLLARALAEGIEGEFVRRIIGLHRLAPRAPSASAETWPWPLKIFTMGGLTILKDDQPLDLKATFQKKPLELLKAIIAFGGREVIEEKVMEALWPDAEGDAASASLKTILHRLRQSLGGEGFVLRKNGRLSLAEHLCWVDFLDFLAAAAQPPDRVGGRERILRLYRGEFLPDDESRWWTVAPRERCKRLFLSLVRDTAETLAAAGQLAEAAGYYEQALAHEELDESLYSRLMTLHGSLGRRDLVAMTFQRCRSALLARLKIEPSVATLRLYRDLMAGKSC